MNLRIPLVALALVAPNLARGDEPPPAGPQLPAAPLPPGDTAVADKTAVMTGQWFAPARGPEPVFGLDLMLGQQMGVRPSLAVYSNERSSLVVEGFYGALLTKFGASEAAGAGARWVTTRGGRDSVTLGPGVDVFFHLDRGRAVVLAPTVDVAWRHGFGDRAAAVLGLTAGVGVGLSGGRNNDRDDAVSGRVTPIIGFYTGLRY